MIGALSYMPLFFGLFWKSGVLLGAALCLNLLLRKQSADLRRLVLSTAVVALLLSMAAAPALPRWTAGVPSWLRFQRLSHDFTPDRPARETRIADEPELMPHNSLPSPLRPASRQTDLTPWLLPLIWSLGAGILLIRFAVSLYGLRRLREASEPMTDPGVLAAASRYGAVASLMQSETIAAPVTWGFLRPVLLVPTGFEALAPECRDAVLRHELAHVQARDFLMRSLAEIARAALWFQPLMWIVRRQLHEEQELACDDRVLASGGKPSVYAKLLMDWDARPEMELLVAVGIANRSCLKRRLYALLDPGLRRNRVTPVCAAGTWFLALAFALPLAAVGVIQNAPPWKAPAGAVYSDLPAASPTTPGLSAPVQMAQATAIPPRGTQRPATEPPPEAIVPATVDSAVLPGQTVRLPEASIGTWDLNLSKSTFGKILVPGAPADQAIGNQRFRIEQIGQTIRLYDLGVASDKSQYMSLSLDGKDTPLGPASLSFRPIDASTFEIVSTLNINNTSWGEVSRFSFSSDGQTLTETMTQTLTEPGEPVQTSKFVLLFSKLPDR